jgi:hypothetical protein
VPGEHNQTTTQPHHTTSQPIPTPRLAREGGAVTPQHPPPPPAAPLQPETEPRHLGFGIFTQTPLPSSCFATARPRRHHHLVRATAPPLLTISRARFARHARNRATAARFRSFDPNPPPASRCVNARPHHHHHLVHTAAPPLFTVPRARFARHA